MSGVLDRLSDRLENEGRPDVPKRESFEEFLLKDAKVKIGGGGYIPYSFDGRPVLRRIAQMFDHVLGSHTGKPLADSSIDVCGGAQWGKTILALNFGAYATGQLFYNWGNYLPDDDLVQGIVDTKLRPDVIEQIDWLADLMEVGKGTDKGGKVVNRKGAFMVTDGDRKAFGMIRGMGKIPTSFSMDIAMEDEKDDIPEKNSKFLTGRMTASSLRLRSSIGTQRVFGRGQHKQFKDGTQEVQLFQVPGEDRKICIEEEWPQVCRLQLGEEPATDDPQLTMSGNFSRKVGREKVRNAKGETVWQDVLETFDYDPAGHFYVADPLTGKELDREEPIFHMRRPDRQRLRKWSIRVSQVAIAGIPLSQPVSRWQAAVKDPDMMTVFFCDVLALPQNTSQAISPEIIKRAQGVEAPFDLSMALREGCKGVAGLDTGNRCWFHAREIEDEFVKRTLWAEDIPLGDVVRRTKALFFRLGLQAIAVDAHPAVQQARDITYGVHGLENYDWPKVDDPEKTRIEFPDDLVWDGKTKRWENVRGFVVQFAGKSGSPTTWKLGIDEQADHVRFYPILQCNRFDMINRVVNELLTPKEQVYRSTKEGVLVEEPVMRLPQRVAGSPAIVETFENHLVTGSEKTEDGDFVDKCENHLLLANGYGALAEMMAGRIVEPKHVMMPKAPRRTKHGQALRRRRERSVQ